MNDLRTIDIARLVEEHGPAVYRFCRSLTYSKEDAEDLFQDAFLRALERPEKLPEAPDQQGYLLSTAYYLWQSRKRKYARRNRIAPIEPMDDRLAGIGASLEEEYLRREENGLVRRLTAELPEKYRLPTILYYALELPVEQVAKLMRLPAGTVKSRLHKARQLIEKGLRDHDYTT